MGCDALAALYPSHTSTHHTGTWNPVAAGSGQATTFFWKISRTYHWDGVYRDRRQRQALINRILEKGVRAHPDPFRPGPTSQGSGLDAPISPHNPRSTFGKPLLGPLGEFLSKATPKSPFLERTISMEVCCEDQKGISVSATFINRYRPIRVRGRM